MDQNDTIKSFNYYYDTVTHLNKNLNRTAFRSSLSFLQWNIRGMNNLDKFDCLKEILAVYGRQIDVLVIGETWVRESRKQLFE